MLKLCSVCKKEKNIEDFPKEKRLKSGYSSRCKECRDIYLKNYRNNLKNKEKAKEYSVKYRKENFEELYEKKKIYLKTELGEKSRKKATSKYNTSIKRKEGSLKKYNNSDKRREYAKEWVKEKRKNDINFRLKQSISSNLNSQLKKVFLKKNGKQTIKYLDYNIELVASHLEKMFDEKMSWNNYGSYWNIDHIIPQVLYNYKDNNEIKKCWDLRNLRPLKKEDNFSKKDFLFLNLIEKYNIDDLLPVGEI
ncbi:MAG: hypothetical protein DRJ01_00580 [Bacteroidetes bacterium]|nr:MAG: hypothetical protein DRJ01_00580 [Bacteroidota bacterium]